MGLFSAIGGAISRGISAVCSGVSTLCSKIGGTAIGSAVSSFVSKLGILPPFQPLGIIKAIITVATIVCKVAEILGLKEEHKDEPDELAVKTEKDDKKPEDFESTEAYIRHLHDDIKLTKEDKEKLEKMSDEERSAYRATGTYLYTKGINEKLGFDNKGTKSFELVGITEEVLGDLVKLQNTLSPAEFVVYSKHLRTNGMGMKQFSDYLHNRSENPSIDKNVQKALADAMSELNPDITEDEIDRKPYALNVED